MWVGERTKGRVRGPKTEAQIDELGRRESRRTWAHTTIISTADRRGLDRVSDRGREGERGRPNGGYLAAVGGRGGGRLVCLDVRGPPYSGRISRQAKQTCRPSGSVGGGVRKGERVPSAAATADAWNVTPSNAPYTRSRPVAGSHGRSGEGEGWGRVRERGEGE